MCQEDGANLELAYGPGLTGIINVGSSCYINAVSASDGAFFSLGLFDGTNLLCCNFTNFVALTFVLLTK